MGMKIGIFDSGLGGLSVLNEALSKLSEHEFLYYADVKNVPYGQKSRDEILKFSFDAVKFLVKNGNIENHFFYAEILNPLNHQHKVK